MPGELTASRNAKKKKGRNRLGNLVAKLFGVKTGKQRQNRIDSAVSSAQGGRKESNLAKRRRLLDSL